MLPTLAIPNSAIPFAFGAPLLYLLGVAIGRFLKRRAGVRLGIFYQLFCLAAACWIPLRGYALVSGMPEGWPWANAVLTHLGAAVALLATVLFIALFRRFYWELWYEAKNRTRAPKFASQVLALLIFTGAVLLVAAYGYNKSIAGLALGSTVVAAILGFALQDLLGNIIAGISLEVGKPFRTGDWLAIDDRHAEVIEVNWRSTRLRTNDDIYLDLPNKLIVGSKIVNLTYPTRQHALRLQVGFDSAIPPNVVKDCLVRAAAQAAGVLQAPAPKAFLKDFLESSISYEVKFWIENEAQFNDIMDAIRTNIWYEAQRNRLRIPFPIRTIQVERRADRKADDNVESARACLRKQPFFELLDDEELTQIVGHARILQFGRGERVIEQGAKGSSMFVLLQGEADVFVRVNDADARVATLRKGDYCGEMSLLTGEPRSATVVARSDCEMCEVGKATLGAVLQSNDLLVQKLGEMLARRRVENEGFLATTASSRQTEQTEYTEGLLRRLRSFFEL